MLVFTDPELTVLPCKTLSRTETPGLPWRHNSRKKPSRVPTFLPASSRMISPAASPEALAGRRARTVEAMAKAGLDGMLLFRQESLYYLTGCEPLSSAGLDFLAG